VLKDALRKHAGLPGQLASHQHQDSLSFCKPNQTPTVQSSFSARFSLCIDWYWLQLNTHLACATGGRRTATSHPSNRR
jgi:hypothetical protein